MGPFGKFFPYDPLFDKNHDGELDWQEDDARQDFEDFMNKRGSYEDKHFLEPDFDPDDRLDREIFDDDFLNDSDDF